MYIDVYVYYKNSTRDGGPLMQRNLAMSVLCIPGEWTVDGCEGGKVRGDGSRGTHGREQKGRTWWLGQEERLLEMIEGLLGPGLSLIMCPFLILQY